MIMVPNIQNIKQDLKARLSKNNLLKKPVLNIFKLEKLSRIKFNLNIYTLLLLAKR